MRVDLSQIPGQGSLQVKPGPGAFTGSLKEGDRVLVEVLSGEKDAVVVKAEGGQIFKARLDTDAVLSQGDKVLLEFSGKEGKLVFLSIMGKEVPADDKTAQSTLVRDFEDKSLAPYATKLSELRMNVTEDASRVMRDLVTRNPGMTLEDAAFIAANKLAGDESLVKAALALLAGGEKTDTLLTRLIDLLSPPETPVQPEDTNSQSQTSQMAATQPQADAPLTSWLRSVEESVTGANTAITPEQEAASGEKTNGQVIITQDDSVLQSRNVIKNVEILQNEGSIVEKPASDVQNSTNVQGGAALEQGKATVETSPGQASVSASPLGIIENETTPNAAAPIPDPAGGASNAALKTSQLNGQTQISSTGSVPPAPDAGSMIAGLLSEIPEFRSAPPSALERFSNMLLRAAGENPGVGKGNTEKLADMFDKLFTRIERSESGAGERLRSVKEELYARLALAEEAISRAAPQAKTELLDQTGRLKDHVRLLNSIDQFAYMQLPIKTGDERKTAELYLFRRKNGRKVDPENANILLALDLENMGHWEGLINIRGKDVSIRMEVRGAEEKEFFSEKTVLLHELLAEAGFKLVNTGISFSEEKTTPLSALSVLDRYVSARSGGIDVTV